MKIKPTTIFTLIIAISVVLISKCQPTWLPDMLIKWVGAYGNKQVSNSWLPYYVYSVIFISSLFAIIIFNRIKNPLGDLILDFTANGLIKAGFKVLGVLIGITLFVFYTEGIDSAYLGLVLSCFLILFTFVPIWAGCLLLEMATKKETEDLMPRGYKVLFYSVSLFSLGVSEIGIIAQLFFS